MSLTMTMTFATAFRIGTGTAGRGLDEVIDPGDPLRASSIKGVLRAEARLLIPGNGGDDHPFVRAVFGGTQVPSPWNLAVSIDRALQVLPQIGIKLNPDGQVEPGAMLMKEVVAVPTATLTITRRRPLTRQGLPEEVTGDPEDYHLALLHVSARLVEKLGQRRTRGLGWVAITSTERDPATDVERVWQVRSEGRA